MTDQQEELSASKLGTFEYWEEAYSREIENFVDHGDVGEIWFGNDSSTKMIKYINSKLNLPKDTPIIDLGCGNGMSLIHFSECEFTNLTGVDYSPKAIELAQKVVNDNKCTGIKLQVFDIIDEPIPKNFTFKLAYDKGTYDAISLSPEEPKKKREAYMKNVKNLLDSGGFLALTSCNWTKNELLQHFTEYFQLEHEIPTKTFSFGGQAGNTIIQLIFVKK